jgi:hypothetical protein
MIITYNCNTFIIQATEFQSQFPAHNKSKLKGSCCGLAKINEKFKRIVSSTPSSGKKPNLT